MNISKCGSAVPEAMLESFAGVLRELVTTDFSIFLS
jgi:hypothetical protein